MKPYLRKIRRSFLAHATIAAALAVTIVFSLKPNTADTTEISISDSASEEDRIFESYIDDLFCQEISASALSLHYTLEQPGNYGITDYNTSLGVYGADNILISAALSENISAALSEFDRNTLSVANRLTLDLLGETVENSMNAATFLYYAEPLRPSTGNQAELPILLAEYTFHDTQDVTDYLEILASVPAYFESICAYEQEKYAQGLFMSDFAAEAVSNQCEEFAASAENNYLLYTFDEKIDTLDGLSENEKISYKNQNQAILTSEVLPAYENIAQTLSSLVSSATNTNTANISEDSSIRTHSTGVSESNSDHAQTVGMSENDSDSTQTIDMSEDNSGSTQTVDMPENSSDSTDMLLAAQAENNANESGLCQFPLGKEYYEFLVRSYTGSNRSVKELWQLTDTQRNADLAKAADLLAKYPELLEQWENPSSDILSASPEEMLAYLEDAISTDFPTIDDCHYTVKYVDESMEAYLSPAFYLTSPLDHFTENSIYINNGSGYEGLKLFTTLAHEGYPGHLYQNAAFCETGSSPLRALLGSAGYTEGWATYVEMLSYRYAGLSDELAELLSCEQSAILSLYASADMGIHYNGWNFSQTLDFFSAYGYSDETTIREIFELIVEEPANYLKYYVGYLEFLSLKDYAKETLGTEYNEQDFHETILKIGPATFPILKEYFLLYYPF